MAGIALSVNIVRFVINRLLFSAPVADWKEKLCRLASELGRVCEKNKLRLTVGKSKVRRCSGMPMGVERMKD